MNWGLGANPDNKVWTTNVPLASGDFDSVIHYPTHVDTFTLNAPPPPGLSVCGPANPATASSFLYFGTSQVRENESTQSLLRYRNIRGLIVIECGSTFISFF